MQQRAKIQCDNVPGEFLSNIEVAMYVLVSLCLSPNPVSPPIALHSWDGQMAVMDLMMLMMMMKKMMMFVNATLRVNNLIGIPLVNDH